MLSTLASVLHESYRTNGTVQVYRSRKNLVTVPEAHLLKTVALWVDHSPWKYYCCCSVHLRVVAQDLGSCRMNEGSFEGQTRKKGVVLKKLKVEMQKVLGQQVCKILLGVWRILVDLSVCGNQLLDLVLI